MGNLDYKQARKALRALKGLVKLQALVRGYLVRKQATATFHSMQALIRAQATVRFQRARVFMSKCSTEAYNSRFGSRAGRSMVNARIPLLAANTSLTKYLKLSLNFFRRDLMTLGMSTQVQSIAKGCHLRLMLQ